MERIAKRKAKINMNKKNYLKSNSYDEDEIK